MIATKLLPLAGVRVARLPFHLECAPDGPTSPIFECDHGVDALVCYACDNPLVDITSEPEEEVIDDDCCRYCGAPLSDYCIAIGTVFCDEICAGGYTSGY